MALVVTQSNISNLHIGRLEQRLELLDTQIGQLSDEIESLAALSDASSFARPYSIEDLAHSLRAEILRLKSELEACQRELLTHRTQAMSEKAQREPPSSADTP